MRKKISVDPGQLFTSESTLFSNVKHCNITLTVLSRWRTMCKKKQNMFERQLLVGWITNQKF